MNFQKKNKKKLLYSLLVLLLGFYLVYNYIIYKPHKVVDKVKSEFVGNASDLLDSIKTQDIKLWLNKIVTIQGKVTSKDDFGIVLNEAIYCQLKKKSNIQSIKAEQSIALKGQIIGYDDLLEELKLKYCIIKNIQK
ncbi:hypothetical protein [uncultured Tenacibaculum sp.]|uniref:hypothetical protein n=1 Tax=uncultured Tenacibaculum sp. TaxID=174713 RepID=UPI00261F03A4|nr:hypothetical protein [uncultured Tenacibaculum sp.]